MISITTKGDWKKTEKFLRGILSPIKMDTLHRYGRKGVEALSKATPVDTGLTAGSWYYKIEQSDGSARIVFCNSNIQNGVPIAIILQYGHGTRNGGWVEGRDYINAAIQPVFDQLADSAWKEVRTR